MVCSPTELGTPIGRGRTADVFPWAGDRVVKLFHRRIRTADIERERRNQDAAHGLGLAVPRVGEIVEVEGRGGLVMERVDGPSMMTAIERGGAPLDELAVQLADLQASLHRGVVSRDLPDQGEEFRLRLTHSRDLEADERDDLLGRLAGLPRGDRLCHGDFHPGNVLLSDGGAVIIDWIAATRGSPAADVARTILLFRGHIDNSDGPEDARAAMWRFHDAYLARSLAAGGLTWSAVEPWLPVLAGVRISENVPEFREWLLGVVRHGLAAS